MYPHSLADSMILDKKEWHLSHNCGHFRQFTILNTEIIAASIRSPQHITDAALSGAHIATTPFNVLKQLFNHPLTDKGIEAISLTDWKKSKKRTSENA